MYKLPRSQIEPRPLNGWMIALTIVVCLFIIWPAIEIIAYLVVFVTATGIERLIHH